MARVYDYIDVLLGNEVPPAHNHVLNPDDDVAANLLRMGETNNQAYRDLILACMDDTSFEIINTAVSDSLPDRNAALAF